jgi:hypothetical protein
MRKTVLDPADANKAGLAPRQRPQRQGGLVNALSPQEWFQVSSAFLNPEYSFGDAALLASMGIQHDRRQRELQGREDQLWERQQQEFQREDQQRASVENIRRILIEGYRENGDEQTAAVVAEAPIDMVLQHYYEDMSPSGRRALEDRELQRQYQQAQIYSALSQGQGGQGTYTGNDLFVDTETGERYIQRQNNRTNAIEYISQSTNQPLRDAEVRGRLRQFESSETGGFSIADIEGFSEFSASVNSGISFGATATELGRLIDEAGPNAAQLMGPGGTAIRSVSALASQLGSLVPLGLQEEAVRSANEFAQEQQRNFERNGNVTAEEAARFAALSVSAAYAVALANNPDGRITESDFRFARNQVLSMDPDQMLERLQGLGDQIGQAMRVRYNVLRQSAPATRQGDIPSFEDYIGAVTEGTNFDASFLFPQRQRRQQSTPPPGATIISGADLLGGG